MTSFKTTWGAHLFGKAKCLLAISIDTYNNRSVLQYGRYEEAEAFFRRACVYCAEDQRKFLQVESDIKQNAFSYRRYLYVERHPYIPAKACLAVRLGLTEKQERGAREEVATLARFKEQEKQWLETTRLARLYGELNAWATDTIHEACDIALLTRTYGKFAVVLQAALKDWAPMNKHAMDSQEVRTLMHWVRDVCLSIGPLDEAMNDKTASADAHEWGGYLEARYGHRSEDEPRWPPPMKACLYLATLHLFDALGSSAAFEIEGWRWAIKFRGWKIEGGFLGQKSASYDMTRLERVFKWHTNPAMKLKVPRDGENSQGWLKFVKETTRALLDRPATRGCVLWLVGLHPWKLANLVAAFARRDCARANVAAHNAEKEACLWIADRGFTGSFSAWLKERWS
jgi:hypothetical protein